MAGSNKSRGIDALLERTESQPASFTVHLYPEHWVLNNGSKFLYHNPTACILDDIRAHRIPVDFLDLFDAAKLPFYDGCMIVELLDYRPQRNKDTPPDRPDRTRVVLQPNSETLWADMCSLSQKYGAKWTDLETLEIESKILMATSPPLCLDPDPHLTRIVNHVARVTTPTVPSSLKRKAVALDPEDDEHEKLRRAKIMAFGNPSRQKLHNPNYHLLDMMREKGRSKPQTPAPAAQVQYLNQSQSQPPQQPTVPSTTPAPPTALSPVDKKPTPQPTKVVTPQVPYTTPTYAHSNAVHAPMAPPQSQATNHFIHQHPQMNPPPPPAQTQAYGNGQEAGKRAPTPAQHPPTAVQARPPPQQYGHVPPPSQPPQTHASPPAQQQMPPTATPAITHQQSQPSTSHPPQHHIVQHPPTQPPRPPSVRPSRTPIPIQHQQHQLQPHHTVMQPPLQPASAPSPVLQQPPPQRHSPITVIPVQPQHRPPSTRPQQTPLMAHAHPRGTQSSPPPHPQPPPQLHPHPHPQHPQPQQPQTLHPGAQHIVSVSHTPQLSAAAAAPVQTSQGQAASAYVASPRQASSQQVPPARTIAATPVPTANPGPGQAVQPTPTLQHTSLPGGPGQGHPQQPQYTQAQLMAALGAGAGGGNYQGQGGQIPPQLLSNPVVAKLRAAAQASAGGGQQGPPVSQGGGGGGGGQGGVGGQGASMQPPLSQGNVGSGGTNTGAPTMTAAHHQQQQFQQLFYAQQQRQSMAKVGRAGTPAVGNASGGGVAVGGQQQQQIGGGMRGSPAHLQALAAATRAGAGQNVSVGGQGQGQQYTPQQLAFLQQHWLRQAAQQQTQVNGGGGGVGVMNANAEQLKLLQAQAQAQAQAAQHHVAAATAAQQQQHSGAGVGRPPTAQGLHTSAPNGGQQNKVPVAGANTAAQQYYLQQMQMQYNLQAGYGWSGRMMVPNANPNAGQQGQQGQQAGGQQKGGPPPGAGAVVGR